MIQNMLCSYVGTIAFSVIFNVPTRFYKYCGLVGMAGWMCYYWSSDWINEPIAAFLATMLVVFLSRIFAVWRKCPITVFLISGIFPLVPGASVYYTAHYFVANKLRLATEYGMNALQIAFAIVLGIVFVVSIPKEWFERRAKKRVVS